MLISVSVSPVLTDFYPYTFTKIVTLKVKRYRGLEVKRFKGIEVYIKIIC